MCAEKVAVGQVFKDFLLHQENSTNAPYSFSSFTERKTKPVDQPTKVMFFSHIGEHEERGVLLFLLPRIEFRPSSL
jgi:hypothetical protein